MKHWRTKDKILLAIVPLLSSLVLRLLALTIRKNVLFPERAYQFPEHGKLAIVAFWHQRLLLMPFLRRQEKISMLISRHRDGELIARTVGYFGIGSIRGSTTRGGSGAIRGMVRAMEGGSNVAITPDGPQGPKHVVQAGVIEIARLTGAPILPLTYSVSRRKVFQSWDHFILPFPFSRAVYIWGEPLIVPRQSTSEELEEKRLLLQNRLKEITKEADQICGHPPT